MPLIGQTRVLIEDLDRTYERLYPLFRRYQEKKTRGKTK
jgi:hypothetical protein